MTKLLIVEDEELVRQLLLDNFAFEGYEVDGADCLRQADVRLANPTDLILLDVNLPDGDGIERLATWRTRGITVPVVICTVKDREIDVVRALDAGADDYVTKPFRIRELLARVRAVLRRRVPVTATILPLGPCRIDFGARLVERGGKTVSLTATEWTLLECLVDHRNHVVSRDQIVELVWGIKDLEDSRAVDVHIGRLRRKLGEGEPPRHIQTVRGLGYKLVC
jgi:two-component system, OmpR family, response regulator MprA